MQKSNLISIVTVTYNAGRVLENTILSVINQEYKEVEYIIVDGNSTDNTIDIINSYRKYFSTIIVEKDNGVYDAMNKGLSIASGEWILFLNAGDIFVDNKVLSKIFYLKDYKDYVAVYGNCINDNRGKLIRCIPKPFFTYKKYSLHSGIGHQCIFVKTNVAKEIKFDALKYRICADYDMLFRLYKRDNRFKYVDVDVSIYETSFGLSARNRILALKECAKIINRKDLQYYKLYMLTVIKKILFKIFIRNRLCKY